VSRPGGLQQRRDDRVLPGRDLPRIPVGVGEVQRPAQLVILRLDRPLELVHQVLAPRDELRGAYRQRDDAAARLRRRLEQRDVHRAGRIRQRQRPAVGPRLELRHAREAHHLGVPLLGLVAVGGVEMDVVDAVEGGDHGDSWSDASVRRRS